MIDVALQALPLSQETGVTLGLVLVVVVPICGAWISIAGRLSKIENRLVSIEFNQSTRWTSEQHRAWALRLSRRNPNLHVPDLDGNEEL